MRIENLNVFDRVLNVFKCFRFSLDILFLLFTSILRADSFKSALQVDSSKEGGGAFLDMFFVAFWLEIKSKALKQALGP